MKTGWTRRSRAKCGATLLRNETVWTLCACHIWGLCLVSHVRQLVTRWMCPIWRCAGVSRVPPNSHAFIVLCLCICNAPATKRNISSGIGYVHAFQLGSLDASLNCIDTAGEILNKVQISVRAVIIFCTYYKEQHLEIINGGNRNVNISPNNAYTHSKK